MMASKLSQPPLIPPQCLSINSCNGIDMVSSTIVGATATDSTLFTVVGQPNKPTAAGNGGLTRGFPCLPSMDSISAVSSPQMYAPPPRCTKISKSYPDPQAFLPKRPAW